MAGNKALNLRPQDGVSWEDVYAIDGAGLTNATRTNFFVQVITGQNVRFARAIYNGTGALTTSEFNAFEIGSTILAPAITTPSIYLKTAATTWKLQAINT